MKKWTRYYEAVPMQILILSKVKIPSFSIDIVIDINTLLGSQQFEKVLQGYMGEILFIHGEKDSRHSEEKVFSIRDFAY
jgi:hypothetical protein